jgi:hypothetical protein
MSPGHVGRRQVERTFAWLGRYRRLSKDYEANPRNRETWISVTMIHRLARNMIPTEFLDSLSVERSPSWADGDSRCGAN